MLGITYLDKGQKTEGENMLAEAEYLGRKVKGKDWTASNGEESYDQLVNFWSR